MHKITRFEESRGEVFVNIEINDDLGMYNYGRWLTPQQAEQVKAEFAEKRESVSKYAARKTSVLGKWATASLAEARRCKQADIAAYEREQPIELKPIKEEPLETKR